VGQDLAGSLARLPRLSTPHRPCCWSRTARTGTGGLRSAGVLLVDEPAPVAVRAELFRSIRRPSRMQPSSPPQPGGRPADPQFWRAHAAVGRRATRCPDDDFAPIRAGSGPSWWAGARLGSKTFRRFRPARRVASRLGTGLAGQLPRMWAARRPDLRALPGSGGRACVLHPDRGLAAGVGRLGGMQLSGRCGSTAERVEGARAGRPDLAPGIRPRHGDPGLPWRECRPTRGMAAGAGADHPGGPAAARRGSAGRPGSAGGADLRAGLGRPTAEAGPGVATRPAGAGSGSIGSVRTEGKSPRCACDPASFGQSGGRPPLRGRGRCRDNRDNCGRSRPSPDVRRCTRRWSLLPLGDIAPPRGARGGVEGLASADEGHLPPLFAVRRRRITGGSGRGC
jgi:hypothetical protein